LDVQAGRRLVEEQDARRVHEGQREVEPALHATRVRPHLAIGGLRQADPLEQFLSSPLALRARKALQRRLELEMLAPGQQRVESGLLERRADRRAHLGALPDHVEAGHRRSTRRRGQERDQHVHRCRLAGAVRAEEAVDLAGSDVEVDPVDGPRPLLEDADKPARFDSMTFVHGRYASSIVELVKYLSRQLSSVP
jgi:hypothetical protein